MVPTQYRRSNREDDRAISRNVSFPGSLIALVNEQARKEGHNNFSTVVIKALVAYLNRENDVRAA